MSVSFVKPQPNPATQERLAEVSRTFTAMARALAPAAQAVGRVSRQMVGLVAAAPAAKEAPMNEPSTHDFGPGKRYWGHDYAITRNIDSGQRLEASGWGPRMKVGDFMLLDNRGRETRYRIAEYRPVMEPNDMWHVALDFAPRQAA